MNNLRLLKDPVVASSDLDVNHTPSNATEARNNENVEVFKNQPDLRKDVPRENEAVHDVSLYF